MEIVNPILDIVNRAGVVGILIGIIIAGQKQVWVWGWQYREMRDLAHSGTAIADKAVDVVANR